MAHGLGDLARQIALAQRDRRASRRLALALLGACISLYPTLPVDAASLLTLKTRQVRRLQRMVARPDHPGRNAALLELCRSERQVALLAEDREYWLQAAAISCRRLLFDAPSAAEADDALLLLARVEQERNRPARVLEAVAELEGRWPHSPHLCSALLVGAEARANGCDKLSEHRGEEGADGESCRGHLVSELQRVARHRACAGPRSALLKRVARYRLAWGFVRSHRQARGRAELRRLWFDSPAQGGFRHRLLRDLARIWASFGPARDSVALLAGQGALGAELVVWVAGGLADQGNLPRLLSFVDEAQQRFAAKDTWRALELQRWSALARLAKLEELQPQLARLTSRLRGSAILRRGVSAQLFAAASRLEREQHSLAAAEWIYQRLTKGGLCGPDGLRRAQDALARLLIDRGAHREALPHLRALMLLCQSGAATGLASCREGSYRLLYALEQGRGEKASKARLQEIAAMASRFIEMHVEDGRGAAVRLLWARALSELGDHQAVLRVAEAGLEEEAESPTPLRVEAIRAARALRRFAVLYRLTHRMQREPWRSLAAEAALLEAERRAAEHLAGARLWVERAVRGHDKKLVARARLLAAKLAARAGDTRGMRRHLAALVADQPHRRGSVARQRAAWILAGGDLVGAAASHLDVARQSVGEADLISAAQLLLWAGDEKRATSLSARARRRLLAADKGSGLSEQILEAGRLLEALRPRRAYGLYLHRATRAWRHERALAGRCLVRAAALAPSSGRAWQLSEQAVHVVGPLRGRRTSAVAGVRLATANTLRRHLASLRPELAVERLSRLVEWLAPVLELRLPRLSTAAAWEMAAAFDALARLLPRMGKELAARAVGLRGRRDQLLMALVKMARHPAGLDRHTLSALRRSSELSAGLKLTHLPPEGRIHSPVMRLLRAGRWAAAEAVATAGLKLHGRYAPLLCARAVARAKQDKVADAVADLQQSHQLAPEGRCARLNLATVALWRADLASARQLLPRMGKGARAVDLVRWLRQAAGSRLSALTRQVR